MCAAIRCPYCLMMKNDHFWMARALDLAKRGLYTAHPNPRVGCIVLSKGEVVAEAWHRRRGEAHAEAAALQLAGEAALGATLYVTLEPCCHQGHTGACTDALIAAGLSRVVVATRDPNPQVNGGGIQKLRDAGLLVTEGVLATESAELNRGFNQRMSTGRPWTRIKLAVSIDGRTALGDGQSQWISCAASRADVQRWRARSSAIITGAHTVVADDPSLTVRDPALADVQQPERIVLDAHFQTSPQARLFELPGRTRIFGAEETVYRAEALRDAGATLETLPSERGRVDLRALLLRLGELEMNEVIVEAGATLCGAFLAAQLVDELLVYQAPHVLGSDARAMFAMPALASMNERMQFELADVRKIGTDLRFRYLRI